RGPEILAERLEVASAPLVPEFEHRVLGLPANLDALRIRCLDRELLRGDRAVEKLRALVGADLDERGVARLVADDAPVAACDICLARDLHLAAAAIRAPTIAALFEFVHRDALVASLELDDELAFV